MIWRVVAFNHIEEQSWERAARVQRVCAVELNNEKLLDKAERYNLIVNGGYDNDF